MLKVIYIYNIYIHVHDTYYITIHMHVHYIYNTHTYRHQNCIRNLV